jgi:hypothetical protein
MGHNKNPFTDPVFDAGPQLASKLGKPNGTSIDHTLVYYDSAMFLSWTVPNTWPLLIAVLVDDTF